MDLHLAKLLHQKWKETIQVRYQTSGKDIIEGRLV